MKKKGFIFVESIVVLVVVALSLSMLISSYSLVSRKTKEKEFYNKASDKYLLYSLSNIGTDDICNYSKKCDSLSGIEEKTFRYGSIDGIGFRADKEGSTYKCTNTKIGKIIFDCEKVFDEMNLVHLYVVEDILRELGDDCQVVDPDDPRKCTVSFYDSGTLEYMKSLRKCKDTDFNIHSTTCDEPYMYLIGVFERTNGEYHYAAIEI